MVIKDILKTVAPVASHIAKDTYYLYRKDKGLSRICNHPLPEPVFEMLDTIERIPYNDNDPVRGCYNGIVLLLGASGLVYRLLTYGQWSKRGQRNEFTEVDEIWSVALVASIDNYVPTYPNEFDNIEYICLNFMAAIVKAGLKDKFRDVFDKLTAIYNSLTTTNTNS